MDGGVFDWQPGVTWFGAVELRGVHMGGPRTVEYSAIGTRFLDCDFSGLVVESGFMSDTRQSLYRDCSFVGADLRGVFPGQSRFEGCTFEDTRLDGWITLEAEFIDCVFRGPVREVTFEGTAKPVSGRALHPPRSTNAFLDNDLTAAELRWVEFRGGIDLDRQRLPDDSRYLLVRDFPERLARLRRAAATWPKDEMRSGVERWLEEASIIGLDRQETLFVIRDEWLQAVDRRILETLLIEG